MGRVIGSLSLDGCRGGNYESLAGVLLAYYKVEVDGGNGNNLLSLLLLSFSPVKYLPLLQIMAELRRS